MADETPAPYNRRERRAAAKTAGKKPSSASTPKQRSDEKHLDIPLAQPDRSGPKSKTLYEIADERMKALAEKGGRPFPKAGMMEGEEVPFPDGLEAAGDNEDFGPAAEAVLYSFTLTTLHFTLDVLVHNQYLEEISWSEIWWRTANVCPILWLTVYLSKTHTAMRFQVLRQLVFLVTSVAAGCFCVYSGNTHGYYAVMKRAPPVGTLWVWTVVEMKLPYAVASIVAVLVYTWWNGFGLF